MLSHKSPSSQIIRLSFVLFAALWTASSFAAAVSTSSREATEIAIEVLKSGGNAVDAACASVFALNASQPHFTGIGGGGFILVSQESVGDSDDVFLDFREMAPSSLSSKAASGKVISAYRNTGGAAVGIPGTVAGCGEAVQKFGKLPWKAIVTPGASLAESGIKITSFFNMELEDQWKRISAFDFTKSLLSNPIDGTRLKTNDILKQSKLAQTLRTIAEKGPKEFYEGSLADSWSSEARSQGVGISKEDLSKYQVISRDPVRFGFGKFIAVTAPAPSSSGVMVGAVMRYIEHYYQKHYRGVQLKLDPASVERYIINIESSDYFGRMRKGNIADPAKGRINLKEFFGTTMETEAWGEIDKKVQGRLKRLALSQRSSKNRSGASSSQRPLGSPSSSSRSGNSMHNFFRDALRGNHTAHVSVVDDRGMAVSLTSSVGAVFGSGITLPKAGFILNSTLEDFDPDLRDLNAPGAGMRPRSDMSPVFIYDTSKRQDALIAAVGAAGGPIIPSAVTQFLQNYYLHGMDEEAASRFPRVHSDENEVEIEKTAGENVLNDLERAGYKVKPVDAIWGVFQGIVRKSSGDTWKTVTEPRYEGYGIVTQAQSDSGELKIIDAHTHTIFTGKKREESGIPQTEEEYFREMKEAGITGAVAHTFTEGEHYKDLRSKNIVHCAGAGARVDVKRIEKGLKSGEYGCIKIYLGYVAQFAYDRQYGPAYKLAEKYDVPVVFHTGDTSDHDALLKYADPLTIDEVAVAHPKVKFVIAHCGNPWIESAAEVAYKNPNVYLDGSAFLVGDLTTLSRDKIDTYAIKPLAWIFGYIDDPSKLMFGTDWPLTSMKPYVEVFKQAIPKEHWKAVFHDNAARVFKLN